MYEKFYRFTAKPFGLAPDPRFFFGSRSHKRAMAYLLYGVKQGEGFIVVTGDVGTGKTTLVQHLLRVLRKENVAVAQIVTTQLEADDLLRLVAASFDLPYDGVDKAVLLRNLEVFFRTCYREGRRVLLIVDEAQNLPRRAIEELRMLSNFQVDGKSLVQSFLLGQKEFRATMRSPGFEQLRQRVIAAYHLRPLDRDEAKGYIEHRLKTVGWQRDPTVADDAYEEIYAHTAGVPRRINLFCDRLFLYVYLEEMHAISRASVRSVARDIAEEQGDGFGDELDDDGLGVDDPVDPGNGERSGVGTNAVVTELEQESRLDAMEKSVGMLSSEVKEEISLLRKALLEAQKGLKGD